MLTLSPVAGLAGDVRVPAKLFLVDDFGMAAFADLVSGKGGGPGSDLNDCVASIVAVLAKALGDDCGAHDDEQEQRQQHHHTKADEMFDVLEHGCLSEPEGASASGTLRHVILDTVERSNER